MRRSRCTEEHGVESQETETLFTEAFHPTRFLPSTSSLFSVRFYFLLLLFVVLKNSCHRGVKKKKVKWALCFLSSSTSLSPSLSLCGSLSIQISALQGVGGRGKITDSRSWGMGSWEGVVGRLAAGGVCARALPPPPPHMSLAISSCSPADRSPLALIVVLSS